MTLSSLGVRAPKRLAQLTWCNNVEDDSPGVTETPGVLDSSLYVALKGLTSTRH
jgi:hypothetical protein